MRRRLLGIAGFATGLAAGTMLYRRASRGQRERVDLYFADGSLVSLHSDSPEAAPLLVHARDALRAAAT